MVADAIGQNGVAVLMQNHGLVVAGSGPRRAADTSEAIENTAEKMLACKASRMESAVIPEDLIRQLREMCGMMPLWRATGLVIIMRIAIKVDARIA